MVHFPMQTGDADLTPCYQCGLRPAVVNLDWLDDGYEVCLQCLVSSLDELEETLIDMQVGAPQITVARVNVGALYRPMPAVKLADTDRSGIARCSVHRDRPGVVVLDFGDDHYPVCFACVVTELDSFESHLKAHGVCCESPVAPRYRPQIRPAGPNPHRPAFGDSDVVLCVGCGHTVSAMDDIASVDDDMSPDGFVSFHVNCPGPDRDELEEERRLEEQHIEEVRAGEYYGPCTAHGETAGR